MTYADGPGNNPGVNSAANLAGKDNRSGALGVSEVMTPVLSRAEATDESTPPDMATATFLFFLTIKLKY